MDAKDIEYFEKDAKKWVRFKVIAKNSDTGNETVQQFERVVLRKVKVRGAGGAEHRPVVSMKVCIGNQLLDEEFSLRDRKRLPGLRMRTRARPTTDRRTGRPAVRPTNPPDLRTAARSKEARGGRKP